MRNASRFARRTLSKAFPGSDVVKGAEPRRPATLPVLTAIAVLLIAAGDQSHVERHLVAGWDADIGSSGSHSKEGGRGSRHAYEPSRRDARTIRAGESKLWG